jgi:hypothetical protein
MRLLIALSLLPLLAQAEASPTTQYLMSEPATLFDVGMARLDHLTSEFERRVGLSWTSAGGKAAVFRADVNGYYDAGDDRIYVSFLVMDSAATEPQMKEGCGMAMNQMAIWLRKSLPGLFLHVRDERSIEAARRFEGIADLFVLRCYVSSGEDSSVGRFWASRTLEDPALEIGPWEAQ